MTIRVATGAIARWIDADTLVMGDMDLGWGVAFTDDTRRQTTQIRLAGINAPDSKVNAPWVDAELRLQGIAYVNLTYPPGTQVVLTSYELDDFGRSLATVTTAAGIDIQADLILKGFVRTGDYPMPKIET